jgi:hypothetical protein
VGLGRSDFPATLSPESEDDRIVHSVKKFLEEHPGVHVAVYSEDMGMQLRCEANDIPVVEPDSNRRLENPQNDLTRRYRQAISELNAVKNRLPALVLHVAEAGQFPQQGKPFNIVLEPSWQPLDVQAELSNLHRRYPKVTESSNQPPVSFLERGMLAVRSGNVTTRDLTTFS